MPKTERSLALLCGLFVLAIHSESSAQWASDGDAEAKGRLAAMYLSGSGVELDLQRGQNLLIESAELGFGPAQLALGEAYLFGNIGLDRDEEIALYWLNRALEHELPLAKYYIGLLFYQGQVVPEDKPKSFQLTLEAAEEGVTDAYFSVGILYWNGDGVTKDDQQAIHWLEKAAESDDISAVTKLATIYLYGVDSVEPDQLAAIRYLTQGAALGDPWAQSTLGSAYLEGDGVGRDTAVAIELLSKGATAGEPFAMYYLGEFLLSGIDENKRDPELGIFWLEKAYGKEPTRQFAAGLLAGAYEDGIGVAPSHSRAIDLYLEADIPVAAAYLLVYGDPELRDNERAISILTTCDDNNKYSGCATFIGNMFRDTSSEMHDPSMALSWFEKGAEAGDLEALLVLSDIYTLGTGVTPDLDVATAYLDEAIEKNGQPGIMPIDVADIYIAYAKLHLHRGNTFEAEEYFRKGLLASEDTDDQDSVFSTVLAMTELGGLYLQQGRFEAALQLYSELRQRSFSDDSTQEAARLMGAIGVASTYGAMGDAERAKAIIDNDPFVQMLTKFPSNSVTHALGMMVLGGMQLGLERHGEASRLLERALPILREALGPGSFYSLTTAGMLGSAKFNLGQNDEAEQLLSTAIDNAELAGVSDTFTFNYAQAELAKVLNARGNKEDAQVLIEAAVDGVISRFDFGDQSTSIGSVTERRRAKDLFSTYVDLASEEKTSNVLDATFASAQYAMSLSVDEAIRNWTLRVDSTNPQFAELVRNLTLAQDRARSLDRRYQRNILNASFDRRDIAKQLSDVDGEIQAIRIAITELGYRAADLRESQPVSIRKIQEVLSDSELLLVYMTAKDKSFGWSISSTNATSFSVDTDLKTLRQRIGTLRESLVPREDGEITEYASEVAQWLFDKLIRPALIDHPEANKLIIVPDGPLIGIPFPALRLSGTSMIDETGKDNGWLNSHYATSLASSVASLKSLRDRASSSLGTKSFLGFGDPVLGKSPDTPRVQLESYSAYFDTRGLGDASRINSLGRLPETAEELTELALLLDGSLDDVFLGDDATETRLKNMALQEFRVLAFATHGLLAGSIVGHGEPALVLTPPNEISALDDGLLTASEIATLKLDADIVILSACDTAAGGADNDAMGLSGLARAFFLAGTRNVLASNWPVNSDAAEQLTTAMFEAMKAVPELSYSEALQSAMLKAQNGAKTELARHPTYWAPFVVIGQ